MADYCDADKNPEAKKYLLAISNGNEAAFSLLWTLWNFEHLYDDLVDRDVVVTTEQAAKWLVRLLEQVSFNPFYKANASALFPLIVGAANRWCDGDEWAASDDPKKREAARFIRCGDVDLYLTAAFLVGGWDHMRAMRDARRYDSEN